MVKERGDYEASEPAWLQPGTGAGAAAVEPHVGSETPWPEGGLSDRSRGDAHRRRLGGEPIGPYRLILCCCCETPRQQ
jgi:hypothetical protein